MALFFYLAITYLQLYRYPIVNVWIKTFGCQMNYHDSERMLSILKDLDYQQVDGPSNADLIILNSCAVRDLAASKFYSALGALTPYKKRGVKIGVAGCVAQTEGDLILSRFNIVDFVIGTDNIDELPNLLKDSKRSNCSDFKDIYEITTKRANFSHRALVNIIKGCNAFCTYCIVPFARGREISRSVESILLDVKKFADEGVKEVTLLGQNVNAYYHDNKSLSFLISAINNENLNDLKLKFISAHPYFFKDDLINCFNLSVLANHIHLPVQSGSNKVLAAMNRHYDRNFYLNLLKKIRSIRPDIAITSDLMVGFPTESRDDFNDSLKLIEEAEFDSIYAYMYSPRKGTNAYSLTSSITREEAKDRLHLLQNTQKEIQTRLRLGLINKKFPVLVDGKQTKNGITSYYGRTQENRIVFFPGENISVGQYYLVKITEATPFSAKGIMEIDK